MFYLLFTYSIIFIIFNLYNTQYKIQIVLSHQVYFSEHRLFSVIFDTFVI